MFADKLKTAIDTEGRLYSKIIEEYPETSIKGLGSPGAGIDYTMPDEPDNVVAMGTEAPASDDGGSGGLSTAAIVFIVIAAIVLPLAIMAMYARYSKVKEEERLERLREYQERTGKDPADLMAPPVSRVVPAGVAEDDEDSIHSESGASENKPKPTAGSSLAAMGAAGSTAALLKKGSA